MSEAQGKKGGKKTFMSSISRMRRNFRGGRPTWQQTLERDKQRREEAKKRARSR